MDRTIFHLKASVPATSLYILICSLMDEGEAPTLDRARTLWNGSEDDLNGAIRELTDRKILEPLPQTMNGGPVRLNLGLNWRRVV
jgi:hypothetical protein